MRYPASEKLEIIRTVETSPLPVRHTLTLPESPADAPRHRRPALQGLRRSAQLSDRRAAVNSRRGVPTSELGQSRLGRSEPQVHKSPLPPIRDRRSWRLERQRLAISGDRVMGGGRRVTWRDQRQ
jgi:hypothetical protein